MDAIGKIAPAAVNEFSEWRVRLAREKAHKFLDWRQQEENVKTFERKKPSERKLNLADVVFKALPKNVMGKSYDVQYGTMFFIKKILASKNPIRYVIVHMNGDSVDGSYYEQQLIKCPVKPNSDTLYLIKPQERYKERTVKGQKQIYVQYLYYPANQGEWILKSDIQSAGEMNKSK